MKISFIECTDIYFNSESRIKRMLRLSLHEASYFVYPTQPFLAKDCGEEGWGQRLMKQF